LALNFAKAILGNKVDLRGIITDPTTEFADAHKDITMNLYVEHGKEGTGIEVVLEHIETGSTIPAVKTTLEKDGDSVVSFVFSPPTQGWPKGNYKLHVTSTTGLQKDFTFKVK